MLLFLWDTINVPSRWQQISPTLVSKPSSAALRIAFILWLTNCPRPSSLDRPYHNLPLLNTIWHLVDGILSGASSRTCLSSRFHCFSAIATRLKWKSRAHQIEKSPSCEYNPTFNFCNLLSISQPFFLLSPTFFLLGLLLLLLGHRANSIKPRLEKPA